MVREFSRFILMCILALPAHHAGAQNHTLTVRNGDRVATLSVADIAALPPARLTADDKGEYEGVAVIDLLTRAGVTFGQTLRGPRLATYLVATGADG